MKKYFYLVFSTSINILLLPATFQPHLICETQFYQNCHTAKAPSISEHIFNIWKPIRKLVLQYGKVQETYITSVKKAQILSSSRTKSCLTEKLSLQTPFFLEILKAVCLTFDLVPKLIQISFQAMEQKLVQRCETKVNADACKSSNMLNIEICVTLHCIGLEYDWKIAFYIRLIFRFMILSQRA